jgi:N-acetyl-anhydromuramyl-L-alanine amidase AmpD
MNPIKILPKIKCPNAAWALAVTIASLVAAGCSTVPHVGQAERRRGDEIVAAGQFFHTGSPVVLWMDPGGYDGYRVERRFAPYDKSDWATTSAEVKEMHTPNRYGLRATALTPEQIEKVRGGGWDLPLLQSVVDQLVMHFDVAGTSRTCFNVLQDHRDLSVHFMVDLDGTIYQTLDLKERAWHATISNTRSIGIEIANMGAYPATKTNNVLNQWYHTDASGETAITIPERFGDGGERVKNFVGHPARQQPVRGVIQGEDLVQYDFTPEQYAALTKLTAALCKVFPKLQCRYPVDAQGKLIPHKLPNDELKNYQGVLGHYHIQTNKDDPGPAFDWDRVVGGAKKILDKESATTLPRGAEELMKDR